MARLLRLASTSGRRCSIKWWPYNNTIRDLLGVTMRPADAFPVDDSGYGFDNIGDVLSLSPMLMEKYINAARAVARAAVFGERYSDKPGQLVVLAPKKMQDDVHAKGNEQHRARESDGGRPPPPRVMVSEL